jgi:hypothetical protein
MGDRKVLVALDDVDHKDQLEALAGDCNWFKQGSRIIITIRDKQLLTAHGVGLIHNVTLLCQAEADASSVGVRLEERIRFKSTKSYHQREITFFLTITYRR